MTKAICLLLFTQFLAFGVVDRIKKALEKKEYEKANELIVKGYEKEPLNPGVDFYHATLLFDREFSGYSLDSARIVIEQAKKKYDSASNELKIELGEEGISSYQLDQLQGRIRDRAFQNTLKDLSISSIDLFQTNFPNTAYEDILSYKKDSIEYDIAKSLGTQTALANFIKENPTSVFKPKADSILDGLRYEVLLENGNLNDYYQFLISYPFTRFIGEIENYILLVSTVSHTPEKYQDFLSFASTESLKKKASDILFYLNGTIQNHINPDSIKQAEEISDVSLFPVMDRNQFGFYDQFGQSRIDFTHSDIPMEYKCNLTADDWIFTWQGDEGIIVTKNGKPIIVNVQDYKNVSKDIGLLKIDNNWALYHKSGFKILDHSVESAEILDGKWIRVESNGKYGLISYLGYPLAEIVYDDIYKEGPFWVFQKNELLAVYTENLILKELEDKGLSLEFKFEDIELVSKNSLIGFRGERECLLDSTLTFLVPWGNYEINPDQSGWYLKSEEGYQLYNQTETEVMDKVHPYLESNEGWLAIQTEDDWILIPRKEGLSPMVDLDSAKLINSFSAVIFKGETSVLLFSSGKRIDLKDDDLVKTFTTNPAFVSISKGNNTTLYSQEGSPIFEGKYESIAFLSDELIRVEVKGKQGLINTKGDWILNPVFESLDEKDGLILTLLKGKIGCFDISVNALIPAKYESRIIKINDYYLAKKEGKYGIITIGQENILEFQYDEINSWNDSTFLVKKEDKFLIMNKNEEAVYDPIESIRLLVENEHNSIYRYVRNGKYGLISNTFGELLSPDFTDIFNIGSVESPLFFADQNLDKAGYHVVSYINQYGELVLSKAYTKAEFDRILCDN